MEEILADPFVVAPRLQLAELYRSEGYAAAAEFLATTAEVLLRDEQPIFAFSRPAGGWFYPEQRQGGPVADARSTARAMELIRAGEPRAAVELLTESIESRGISTTLAGTWSYGVLWAAAMEGKPARVQEPALRMFLTVVEETPVSPTGSTWDDYRMLGAEVMSRGV